MDFVHVLEQDKLDFLWQPMEHIVDDFVQFFYLICIGKYIIA